MYEGTLQNSIFIFTPLLINSFRCFPYTRLFFVKTTNVSLTCPHYERGVVIEFVKIIFFGVWFPYIKIVEHWNVCNLCCVV